MSPRPRRYLGLVPEGPPARADEVPSTWAQARPALLRLCAGEPLLLAESDVDFVDLVNTAPEVGDFLLDPDADPDEYSLAEVAVEFFCTRYGIQRHGEGDRLQSVISAYRRHLVPFLVELAAGRPEDRRGVAHLRISHLEMLPRVLAGARPLPAATVAGDRLGRRGIGCLYLSRADAAAVTVGGRTALEVAVADGSVPLHRDVRTGERIVRAADLRAAGLLIESTTPHGLAKSTAGNVLRDLGLAIERARDHGATVRGRFRLEATEPLPKHRQRQAKPKASYVTLGDVARVNTQMRIIGQVVLWIARLTGERISEVYGLHLTDYVRDEDGRPWLVINKQGGISSLGRDPETGRFHRQDEKKRTKTPAGVRTIPIPTQLAALLDALVAAFHTDAETGRVDWSARLIPGLQKEDASGQSSFRTWLKEAQEVAGASFDPHDTRASLITDLLDAGVDRRLAHCYAGHELPEASIQDRHYDLGPYSELLLPIAEMLEQRITAQLGTDDLRAPTTRRESWGRGTRRHRQSGWIEGQLQELGWRSTGDTAGPRELVVSEVAARIQRSAPYTQKLMRSGTIASHQRLWGSRRVWVAYEDAVGRYLQASEGLTVSELAAELGWGYHQVWHVLRELALVDPDRQRGTAIRLDAATADRLRAEVARRVDASTGALTVRDAGELLDMEVGTVETLIRQRHLRTTDAPNGARLRWVTRASVEAYDRAHPPAAAKPDDASDDGAGAEDLLTFTEARRLLAVTRHQLSALVTTRQLHTAQRAGSRHIYITVSSTVTWATRTGRVSTALELGARLNPRRRAVGAR